MSLFRPSPTKKVATAVMLLLLLLSFLLLLFSFNSKSPHSSRVCSHRATIGSGQVSRTNQELADTLRLLYEKNIHCYDVDLSQLKDGTVIVGHPSSFEKVQSSSSSGHPSVSTLFAFLRQTYPYTSATLELKGQLINNADFAKKLEMDAFSFGVLDQIAVEGIEGPSKVKTFIALRDRIGQERGAGCGLPEGWIWGTKATEAAVLNVYRSIKSIDVILPSAICFNEEAVHKALALWLKEKKEKGNSVNNIHPLIQPWVFDSSRDAEAAFSSFTKSNNDLNQEIFTHVTKFISDEPILLAQALQ
jgi:hypothetical protein